MALGTEDSEGLRLPGELPPELRRLHHHSHLSKPAITHLYSSNSADGFAAEVYPGVLQENHLTDLDKDDEDLFKVVDRLDHVIERLARSCKVKPDIDMHTDTEISGEKPSDLRILEDRVDRIIQRLSKSGYVSRVSKEFCVMPVTSETENGKPGPISPSSASSPARTCQKLATAQDKNTLLIAQLSHEKLACAPSMALSPFSPSRTDKTPSKTPKDDQLHNSTTPSSSFRIPLLTPKCLLSKFSWAEKPEVLASPRSSGRLSGSGRSGRLSTALSFLASPRKTGCGSLGGGWIGSPTTTPVGDAYHLER